MEKVKEQFDRVKRWHTRFHEIHSDREHTRDSLYNQDVVYAFFQNCWSLKDWIINSSILSEEKVGVIKDFFYTNTDMKICRDIANGSKHLSINKPSIDSNISMSSSVISLSIGGGVPKEEVFYWIHAKGFPPLNAFDLASTLLAVTEGFLKKQGLLN